MLRFLRKWIGRQPEMQVRTKVRFLAEEDGLSEQSLKAALCKSFAQDPAIVRAYLVRVEYAPSSNYEVALCLRAPEDVRVVQSVGREFAALFGPDEHLDTVFVDDAQEAKIREVASAFFERAGA
jgi:hypothetical protein